MILVESECVSKRTWADRILALAPALPATAESAGAGIKGAPNVPSLGKPAPFDTLLRYAATRDAEHRAMKTISIPSSPELVEGRIEGCGLVGTPPPAAPLDTTSALLRFTRAAGLISFSSLMSIPRGATLFNVSKLRLLSQPTQ
jgi:hypothetical protein